MMNRLWVRISLAIMVVVIFATLLPMVIGIAVREFRYQGEPLPPPSRKSGPGRTHARRAGSLPGGAAPFPREIRPG